MPRTAILWLSSVLCLLTPLSLSAQQACPLPAPPAAGAEPNIFSLEQERYLGEAMAEHIGRYYKILEEETLNARLEQIGRRLAEQLPGGDFEFQFYLSDLPMANAFAAPGGRIYTSRKLVALTQSEDELAGVLAHEMAHVLARDNAIHATRLFREVLGVTEVSTRENIFEHYHRLIDNFYRKKIRAHDKGEQREQIFADRMGLYLAAKAGYNPEAYPQFLDRLTYTKGKTGSWLGDLFGTTRPEARRLRELLRLVGTIPAACRGEAAGHPPEDYRAWKSAVVAYTGLGRKESVPHLQARKALQPPLQSEMNHLRFSPDGNYVLAQDDSSIHVLSREPFEPLFRIDAQDAHAAQFTPDSAGVVFHTPTLRVEWWSLEDEQRAAVHELSPEKECLQTRLSPDGKFLACFDKEWGLALFDVPTGQTVFHKKSFYAPTLPGHYFELLIIRVKAILLEIEPEIVQMRFSPDGRYLVAARNDTTLALDLNTRQPVKLAGSVKKLLRSQFAFLGPDRIIGVDSYSPEKSGVVRFPTGERVARLELGYNAMTAAAAGDYVLLRPIKDYPVGVLDPATQKIFLANNKSAFDIHSTVTVAEQRNGELFLRETKTGEILARAQLPRSPLGRLRAATASPDLAWLAVSERNRGAVWNLSSGQRAYHIRGFRGGYFHPEGTLYADFPEFEKTPRKVARLDLRGTDIQERQEIDQSEARQHGPYLLWTRPAKKDNSDENVYLEAADVVTKSQLWSRHFPKEAPWRHASPSAGTLALVWRLSTGAAKQALKENPALRTRVQGRKDAKYDYLVEVLDIKTGRTLGSLVVETGKGSIYIEGVLAAGEWVLVADDENRTLVYSLASGEQKGRVFGQRPTVNTAAGLLCVESTAGQLLLYDLRTLEKLEQLDFSNPVSFIQFDAAGQRLFVLTADQTGYVVDLSAVAGRAGAGASR